MLQPTRIIAPMTPQGLAIENNKLKDLLIRVLDANIAKGCKPLNPIHPRIKLILDIQDILYSSKPYL
jgi:hypothetical protein